MTKQTNTNSPFGLLTWWTIHQGNYDVAELINLGIQVNLPQRVLELLTGMDEKSAWLKATQLGAKGMESTTHDPTLKAKYLTKNLRDETRAIVREVRDLDNKRVESVQVATVGRDGNYITAEVEEVVLSNGHFNELEQLLYDMQSRMDDKVSRIDDQKVRYAVLQWLASVYRVCVRGTGGVYFIPIVPANEEDRTRQALAVREWVAQTSVGSFSVVSLREDDATNLNEFQESAVNEVLAELDAIKASLDKYENNQKMNDGSRMYSASSQVTNLQSLKEKVDNLNESLGDVMDRVSAEFVLVQKKAIKMQQESAQEVQLAALKREESTTSNQSNLKAGTVADRKRKRVFA